MRRYFWILLVAALVATPLLANDSAERLQRAYIQHQSHLQIEARARIVQRLPDDTRGSRHQRFIVATSTGQTLLIAHNIDLAPRIADLTAGETIAFFGEYEWNDKGGVIHWTHRDPDGQHPHGWIDYRGQRYW